MVQTSLLRFMGTAAMVLALLLASVAIAVVATGQPLSAHTGAMSKGRPASTATVAALRKADVPDAPAVVDGP